MSFEQAPSIPKTIWICWLFGKKMQFAVHFSHEIPWYRRFISYIVLGSEWERETE